MRTILHITNLYIIIIPIVYGFILYKKLDKTMKLFYLFLIYNLFVNFLARAFAHIYGNNLIVYNTSQFASGVLLVLLFNSFDEIKLAKLKVIYLIPIFIIVWTFFYSTEIDSFNNYSSISILISSFLILIFALSYLVNLSSITKTIIYKSHIFWLLSGIIWMYLLMSIPDFLFLFISIYEIVNMQIIVIINNVISVLCFTLAFYFYNKQYNENHQLQKSNS